MKKRFIVHPVLFAVLPVLLLYAHNIGPLSVAEVLLPAALAAFASLLLWLVLGRILRNGAQAALLVTLFWLWFFSYGHVLALVKQTPAIGWLISQQYTVTILYCVLLFVAVTLLIRYARKWRAASSILNIVAVVLVGWQVVTIGRYEFARLRAARSAPEAEAIASAKAPGTRTPPNIYFIILDGYARADVLQDLYHYDNSNFLDYLEQKGFFVARSGRANYSQTLLSLASCLNLDYLDDLVERLGRESGNRSPLEMMVKRSKVREFLEKRGYQTVAFATGYDGTEIQTADVALGQVDGLSQFQSVLLNTTPLPSAFVSRWLFGLDEADLHRRRVLYTFEHLADPVALRPPVFVFAHIVSPHPPFVFDRNGEAVALTGPYDLGDGPQVAGSREEYASKYIEQLMFVNKQIEAAVDRLLAAEYPTVIILQADHGPGSRWDVAEKDETAQRERLATLNACYLPGGDDVTLSDDLSPVNVFRIVFNRYFGSDLPLLPNESYFSPWSYPYAFTRVTEAVSATATPAASAARRGGRRSGPAAP